VAQLSTTRILLPRNAVVKPNRTKFSIAHFQVIE
jgi:hypothetical protein